MYGCESWTIKRAEHRRIDAFELWCWRRPLRVPWIAGRSNQSIILGVHWKDWCWSWNFNTLATWCEELTHLKRPWCWERLRAGRKGDDRGWDGWMASPTQWTWVWVDSEIWWWTGRPGMRRFLGSQRVGHDWVTELNWTEGVEKNWPHFSNENISRPPRSINLRSVNQYYSLIVNNGNLQLIWLGQIIAGSYRRRKWQPTPVLLPGKSRGRRSLVGCSPCGRTESDTTEVT